MLFAAILCYLQLGQSYSATDPARARMYLQRIIGIGRDFGGALGRARTVLAARATTGG